MRKEFLPFHRHDVGPEEIRAVTEVLQSPWITSGPKAAEFEARFAEAVGARYALAVNSCTAALHLSLDAIGLRADDEVLVPTMTFTATAETVMYFKARPVLVDVDRDTQNIDLVDAARKITPKTKAIFAVHVAGLPCNMIALEEFARVHKIHLLEDAAHAFPARSQGRAIGSISAATSFSFYATKTITTGEGGMLTTNDSKIAERAKVMRIHGLDRDAWKRSENADSWYYEVIEPGFKYNLTDIAAAMGLEQLKKAEVFRQKRQALAKFYSEALSSSSELLTPPNGLTGDLHSWHLYTLRLKLDGLKIDRSSFIRELKDLQIGASVHWIPLHLHPYYRNTFGYQASDFPNATWLSERIVSLPLFPSMTQSDAEDVVDAVQSLVKRHRR